MNKAEVRRLKDLFGEDSSKFFSEMEKKLENEQEYSNHFLLYKNNLRKLEREYDNGNGSITREIYNIDLDKLSRKIFSFIDEVVEYLSELKVDDESRDKEQKSEDSILRILRKLNFSKPLKYFRDLSNTNRPLLPFIIKAEKGYGQRWLYNKLIHDYFERFDFTQPILIDFKENAISSFEDLIDKLCQDLQVEEYKNKPIRKKKLSVKNQLLKKMGTASQIFIFRGAFSYLEKEFEDFYEILLSISDEIEENEKIDTNYIKCIVLIIEENDYSFLNHKDKFIFSSNTPSYKAKIEKELKFIDLDFITPITTNCIEEWLGELPEHILECIECDESYFEKLIKECDNGHPDKVIPAICKLINIDFEQKKNLWLKH